jgi:hypothetical protein
MLVLSEAISKKHFQLKWAHLLTRPACLVRLVYNTTILITEVQAPGGYPQKLVQSSYDKTQD